MMPSRLLDCIYAVVISLIVPIFVMCVGGPMYMGLWYYFLVSIIALILAMLFQVKAFFLSGTALICAISFLPYMLFNVFATRPEGLIGLGHFFSLPGAILGLSTGAFISKKYKKPVTILCCAILGIGVGFFVNQLLMCNIVMWCGPLSFALR